MRNDYFLIIIEDKREVPTKQQQIWSIGKPNWMQFQKKSTITTRVQDQNTIEEAHSCLIKITLQAAEKTILKHSQR